MVGNQSIDGIWGDATGGGQKLQIEAIIFDFDGVIADSEALANTVLAEHVTDLGLPTTLDDALDRYMGRRWPEVMAMIQKGIAGALPADFSNRLKAATLDRFRSDLREVQGATAFIRQFHQLRRCIASSSSIARLTLCIDVLGLGDDFSNYVYSADMVQRGKPHPDIFLYAVEKIGVNARHCLVIEDSSSGIQASKAAGMISVGLCAGSHLRAGHAQRLTEAGAIFVAASWEEAADYVSTLI